MIPDNSETCSKLRKWNINQNDSKVKDAVLLVVPLLLFNES